MRSRLLILSVLPLHILKTAYLDSSGRANAVGQFILGDSNKYLKHSTPPFRFSRYFSSSLLYCLSVGQNKSPNYRQKLGFYCLTCMLVTRTKSISNQNGVLLLVREHFFFSQGGGQNPGQEQIFYSDKDWTIAIEPLNLASQAYYQDANVKVIPNFKIVFFQEKPFYLQSFP